MSMNSAPQTTPQQVIARDVVADGDPRGEIVADRILAALGAAGLVVVPREPTEAMGRAGHAAVSGPGDYLLAWHAMLDAADAC